MEYPHQSVLSARDRDLIINLGISLDHIQKNPSIEFRVLTQDLIFQFHNFYSGSTLCLLNVTISTLLITI